MCKIIATSMEERSKRLQHLLKRNEEMQVLHNSKSKKAHTLPTGTAGLFSSYGSSMVKKDWMQTDKCNLPKLDSRRRSLSAGKIVPTPTTLAIHRRCSSVIGTDNNSFAQALHRFASTELPTSSSNSNFPHGLHRMSRGGSDADVESLCSTTDTRHLFTKRISVASIDSNRTQTTSPTNQLQSTKHSMHLSDSERYLSDDGATPSWRTNEAYKRKRFSLTSLQYYNAIEPGT